MYVPSPLLLFDILMSLDVEGRFGASIPQLNNSSCFLPCPATDYLYPQDFRKWYRAAEVLNLAGLVCMVFLLLSYIVLPAEKTRRHYLSCCLIIAAMFLAVSRRYWCDVFTITNVRAAWIRHSTPHETGTVLR